MYSTRGSGRSKFMFVDFRGVVLSLCGRIGLLVGWRMIGMS
jgi:hypothetical protein